MVDISGRHEEDALMFGQVRVQRPLSMTRTVLSRGPVSPGLVSIVAEVSVYGSDHVLAWIAWSWGHRRKNRYSP